MPRAIISAGHTSKEKGAEANGLVEYDLTHKIANFVIEELRNAGVLTLGVPPDMNLASRIEWINNTGYSEENDDIAVEIHVNDGGLTGMEGWYKDKGENKSFNLTKSIIDRVCSDLDLKYQGVKSEYEHPLKKLAFVHYLEPVPALVECLYIDNEKDAEFLKDEENLRELAKSIANGIQDYWAKKGEVELSDTNEQIDKSSTSSNNLSKQKEQVIDSIVVPNQMNQQTSVPSDVNTTNQVLSSSSASSGPSLGKQAGNVPNVRMGAVATGTAVGVGMGVASQGGSHNIGTDGASQYPSATLTNQQNIQPISFGERERRRLFIEDLYTKALGRKPNFQETTYFINNWEGEVQLTLRMLDSQDHADILQKAIDYEKMREEIKEKDNIISRLKIEIRDKDGIIKNLNRLVVEKNMMINELRGESRNDTSKQDMSDATNHGSINTSQYEDEKNNGFYARLKKFWEDLV